MKVLIAPQELKGTLTGPQAAEVMADALRAARPGWALELLPLADGGPGTLELLTSRLDGHLHAAKVRGPLGAPVAARWGVLPGEVAVVELAAAAGLALVPADERRPLDATTHGVGELVHAALDAGSRRIIVGAGGSATTDGGAGAAAALGVRFLDAAGAALGPTPRTLRDVARVDLSRRDHRLERCQLEVWTDVKNPLLGPTGASRVFAPQKGASPGEVELLEAGLASLEAVVRRDTGADLATRPGAGAAGGLGWGLAALCGATLRPGFLSIASLLDLGAVVDGCDLVLTGEGRLDAQSAFEKGPWALGHLAHARGKKVVAFVGRCDCPPDAWEERFDDVVVTGPDVPRAPGEAAKRLHAAVRLWAEGQ